MKKILVIAAMMAMFVACKSVEEKAAEYQLEIQAAYASGDIEKGDKLVEEYLEWVDSLDPEDKAAALSVEL